jgi:hypothetical protein
MRTETVRYLMVLALFAAVCGLAAERCPAQLGGTSVVNIDQHMVVDMHGNAQVTVQMKLTAPQFQQWQMRYGQNPSLLRREMGKLVSQYDTYDFNVVKNEMERQVTVSFKVRGMIRYKGRGLFEFDVPKQWRGGQRVGGEYQFHYPESLGPNQIAQHTVKVTLPAKAGGFNEQLSEDGDKLIQYRMKVGQSGGGSLIGAIVLLLVGAVLVGVSFVLPKG